jgi:membrane protein DedA with SNARE-associated domain
LQELVSPLPSFLVFVPGGAAPQSQGASVWHIIILSFVIGIARVLAGLMLYWLSSKLRLWLFAKRQSWFGLKKSQLERAQDKLSKKGGWWAVFSLWALPFVPGTLISLAAGFVKMPTLTFVTATYTGSIINALTYLLIGYYGLDAATSLMS